MLREELAKEGRAIARIVQIASEDYLRDRQVSDLRQFADQVTGYERVLGVRVFDREGRVTFQPAALDPYPFQAWGDLHRVLDDGRTVEMRRPVGVQSAVGFIVPLRDPAGEIVGAVQVLQLEAYVAQDERSTRDFILVLTLAMVLATLVTVTLVTRASISRPIAKLVQRFREVGAREIPTRVPTRGSDELAVLSREFNGMCERLEGARRTLASEQGHRRRMEEQLRVAERLAGLGRLAAGLAHEVGTPLNVIIGRAESLQKSCSPDDPAHRHLRTIVAQGERIVRIVRDMLDFARMKPPRHVPTDPRATIRGVLDLMDRQCEAQGVVIEANLAEDLPPITADPDQLQQVFLNLVVNALDAMPEGGRLRVTARVESATNPQGGGAAQACLALTFEDTGRGIAREDLSRVFDPFFTTKEAGKGTGLGLSVSYGIIEEHGGWFDVQSEVGSGTRFTIWLPLGRTAEDPKSEGVA